MRPLYKKLLIALLLVVVIGAIAWPTASEAGCAPWNVSCMLIRMVTSIIMGVINAIQGLLAMLAYVFAALIEWVITLGSGVINLPVVQAGFKVSLGLVNLMLVIGMIISAFQIILGIDDHHAKERIKNVILAALLINFSLLFAGFLLDVSNVFTNFFLSKVTGAQIADAFSLSRLANMIEPNGDITTISGFLSLLPLALFSLAITGLALIILIAVFITALVRNIYVAVLLTIMPLAWGCWVFPGLGKYHHDWWEEFIKQGVIVLPTITFFLFLTVSTAASMGQATAIPANLTAVNGFFGTIMNVLLQMFILGAFLIGGLKISQKAGAAGASAGMTMAKAAGGAAYKARLRIGGKEYGLQKGVQGAAGGIGKYLSQMQSGRLKLPYVGGVQNPNSMAGKALSAISSAVGIGALSNKLAGGSHADHDIEEFRKSNLSNKGYEEVKIFVPQNSIEAAAKLQRLAELDKLGDYSKENPKDAIDLIHQYGEATHKHGEGLKELKEVKEFVALNPQMALEVYGHQDPPGSGTYVADMKPTDADQSAANERVLREATNKATAEEMGKRDPSSYDQTPAGLTTEQRLRAKIVFDATISSNRNIQNVVRHSAQRAQEFENVVLARMGQVAPALAGTISQQVKDLRENEVRIRESRLANGNDPATNPDLRALQAERVRISRDVETALGAIAGAADQAEARRLVTALKVKDQAINQSTTI